MTIGNLDTFPRAGVRLSRTGAPDELRLHTPSSGGVVIISGDALERIREQWCADDWLVADVLNEGEYLQAVVLGFFTRGRLDARRGHSSVHELPVPDLVVYLGIVPELKTRISFPLAALDAKRLFLPRTPGRLKALVLGQPLRLDEVAALSVGVKPTHHEQTTRISNLRVEHAEPDYPLDDVRLVDMFGQWKLGTWPGKTVSEVQLTRRARVERHQSSAEATTEPESAPRAAANEASGYFRVDRTAGRWSLIDPDGHDFYSLGVDCVSPAIGAHTTGIERLYQWLPPREGVFSECWRDHDGATWFDFLRANLIRAYGASWRKRWTEIAANDLSAWGFNTVGNWSSKRFIRAAGIPYVWPLEGFPATEGTIFRDFPDVFNDEYTRASRRFALQLEEFRGDRLMIGYFLRNEPQWAFVDDINLAEYLLETQAGSATRDALVRFLSQRYGGDVRRFAEAWEWPSSFRGDHPRRPQSWSELARPVARAAAISPTARRDLEAFTRLMIERYVRVPSEACKAVDPDHLNLGLRWAWISQDALYAGSEHCDVFSINCYKANPSQSIEDAGRRSRRPVIVGEFHFGALDRGLPATGLKGVRTQRDRGHAYRHYVEQAAASPFSVGVHYFTLYDQAVLGRFDGENFQIGLVDTCNRPHEEFVREVRAVNTTIREVIRGERQPAPTAPEATTIGF